MATLSDCRCSGDKAVEVTGTRGAKRTRVNNLLAAASNIAADEVTGFWSRLLNDSSMENFADLEKLLAGCEIIAALDDLGLLAP